jgi:hypothetical protein
MRKGNGAPGKEKRRFSDTTEAPFIRQVAFDIQARSADAWTQPALSTAEGASPI